MFCPIGLRWRREMKQAHKQASEENLRLKGSNYYMFLSATYSIHTSPPICIFICFLLLICCGLLIFFLRHCELCWKNRLGQQNFTVILDCCHVAALSHLPSQGLPSFPNSCRYGPCQDLTTTDQSLASSVFGSGQPVKQQRLPIAFSHSTSFFLILSFSFFQFLPLANEILPSSASNKLNMHPLAAAKYHF